MSTSPRVCCATLRLRSWGVASPLASGLASYAEELLPTALDDDWASTVQLSLIPLLSSHRGGKFPAVKPETIPGICWCLVLIGSGQSLLVRP